MSDGPTTSPGLDRAFVTAAQATPVAVKNLSDVSAVDAGSRRTCALTADRAVRYWGSNGCGQLGPPVPTPEAPLVVVPVLS